MKKLTYNKHEAIALITEVYVDKFKKDYGKLNEQQQVELFDVVYDTVCESCRTKKRITQNEIKIVASKVYDNAVIMFEL